MLSHICATVAHFFVKALRNITKAVHNFFALIDIICNFAPYAAFMGLVEKGKRGVFHMKSPVFLFINENFIISLCRFKINVYLCNILKIIVQ